MPFCWETNCTQEFFSFPNPLCPSILSLGFLFVSMGIYTPFCKFKGKILANENYEDFSESKKTKDKFEEGNCSLEFVLDHFGKYCHSTWGLQEEFCRPAGRRAAQVAQW